MGGIFVSYRHKDSAGHAGRLYDRLREHYGVRRVFRDVDYLKPGEDFVEAIERALAACNVFVLVMGRDWADARNERGERRLDDPADFIRLELERALARGVLVLPVLVEGARMVDATELPEALRPLARRQAIDLSEARWDYDVHQLVRRIDEVLGPRASFARSRTLRAAAGILVIALGALASRPWWPGVQAARPETSVPADSLTAPAVAASATADSLVAGSDPVDSTANEPALDPPPPDTVERPRRGRTPPDVRPRSVLVPAVVGTSARAAVARLDSLGLRARVEYNSIGRSPGSVFAQKPGAGTALEPGDTVRLYAEATVPPGAIAAGRLFLTPGEVIDLDREEDVRAGWDVSYYRGKDAIDRLEFGRDVLGGGLRVPDGQRVDASSSAVCAHVPLSKQPIALKPGRLLHVCLKTTRGRVALLRVLATGGDAAEVSISFTTW